MTASVPAPAGAVAQPANDGEFELVESTAGWQLTITLTERLREALARGGAGEQLHFGIRIAPNLVPGEPFAARLRIHDPQARPRPH